MNPDPRRGFKLIDLMFAVLVVGLLFALFMPALNTNCGVGRRSQCQNNMRQLGLGLLGFCNARNCFPNAGTISDDPAVHQGDPTRSNLYLAVTDPAGFADPTDPLLFNWVVEILPYID